MAYFIYHLSWATSGLVELWGAPWGGCCMKFFYVFVWRLAVVAATWQERRRHWIHCHLMSHKFVSPSAVAVCVMQAEAMAYVLSRLLSLHSDRPSSSALLKFIYILIYFATLQWFWAAPASASAPAPALHQLASTNIAQDIVVRLRVALLRGNFAGRENENSLCISLLAQVF